MLIEFCCPVCQAALAIKKKTVGGQVNCPKCQKLILLPEESPLPRPDEDTPPFSPKASHPSANVSQAIKISVDPYRRDLETKSGLLNDAVEMIKTRNQRIKEIETLVLGTQKDLWALEVDYDERKEDYKRCQTQLHELREEIKTEREAAPARNERIRELENAVAERQTRIGELEGEIETFRSKKDMLKERLANLVRHSENLDAQVKLARSVLGEDGEVRRIFDKAGEDLRNATERAETVGADADRAAELLAAASGKLLELSAQVQDRDRRRSEMEELVKSSSQDMQLALDERNQWKKRAAELEKELEEARRTIEQAGADGDQALEAERSKQSALELELKESSRLVEELREDLRGAQAISKEQEETLALLRTRLEEERTEAANILEARVAETAAGSEKREASLSARIEELREELEEAEEKTAEALRNQQQLAEQSLKGEEKRKDLKRRLDEALARIAELENA